METKAELMVVEQMVAALYDSMHDFELFTSLSLLYFAALSFTETARRLGRPQLAQSFLLTDNEKFGPQASACFEQAVVGLTPIQRTRLMEQIRQTIEPFDVAGLTDQSRGNWYPVNVDDLFAASEKLGVGHEQITELLVRSGFFESEQRRGHDL